MQMHVLYVKLTANKSIDINNDSLIDKHEQRTSPPTSICDPYMGSELYFNPKGQDKVYLFKQPRAHPYKYTHLWHNL